MKLSLIAEVGGLGLLAIAGGLIIIPLGIAIAGLGLLWVSFRLDEGREKRRTGDLR